MKHFALVDITDGNNEVIGIFDNITLNEVGVNSLNNRLGEAIGVHLDANNEEFSVDIVSLEDIKEYKPKELSIEIDGLNYFVELQQVFFY